MKSSQRRFIFCLFPWLFIATVLFLRLLWVLQHPLPKMAPLPRFRPPYPRVIQAPAVTDCVPVGVYVLPDSSMQSTSPAVSYDSSNFINANNQFMVADRDFLYLFRTEDTHLIQRWPFKSLETFVMSAGTPNEWILSSKQKDGEITQVFSTVAGKVIDTINNMASVKTMSVDARFLVGQSASSSRKSAINPYHVYDRRTKKQITLPTRKTDYPEPRFWPNEQTVCLSNEGEPLALFDAATGKPVPFPEPLQGKVKQIVAVNHYQNYDAIVLKDGAVECYQNGNFSTPIRIFGIPASSKIDGMYFGLWSTRYCLVGYRTLDVDNSNTYLEKTDIFSMDNGARLARFSRVAEATRKKPELIERIGGKDFLLINSNRESAPMRYWENPDKLDLPLSTQENDRKHSFYRLFDGPRKFHFQTRLLQTGQDFIAPEIPNFCRGHFSPDGRFYVSVGLRQQKLASGKSGIAITTWKLPN
jgi:hypothetical protein